MARAVMLPRPGGSGNVLRNVIELMPGQAVLCAQMNERAVEAENAAVCSIAQRRSSGGDCVEHRGEVAGRGIDDLQHLGGRSLLIQCLACLGQSRAFSIAMTACAAKFCNSAICRSVNGRTSCRWALI